MAALNLFGGLMYLTHKCSGLLGQEKISLSEELQRHVTVDEVILRFLEAFKETYK